MVTNMQLENYFNNYNGDKATIEEKFMTKSTIELAKPIVLNKNILNLGLGNGLTSKNLEPYVNSMVILEGSKKIIEKFAYKSEKSIIIDSFFEVYKTNKRFDVILANHVLEHVNDPVDLMKIKFHEWLTDDGVVFITVPNAYSLHRLIGKEMGLLKNIYDLNNSDINAGHQRVYDINLLKEQIDVANFDIIDEGGYNLKLLSLAQMKDWPQELLDAIFEVSKKMPADICTNLWFIIKKKL